MDWCFGDETVERLSLEGVEGGELEAAVANHNLLLSNIHKMEGEWKEGRQKREKNLHSISYLYSLLFPGL